MNRVEFNALKTGDQIIYNEKPEVVWIVDHPVGSQTAKAWKQVGTFSEITPAGGGACEGESCLIASTVTPNGRGSKRLSQLFSDPTYWTKVE